MEGGLLSAEQAVQQVFISCCCYQYVKLRIHRSIGLGLSMIVKKHLLALFPCCSSVGMQARNTQFLMKYLMCLDF